MRTSLSFAVVLCTIATPGVSAEIDWRVGGELNFEFATGLGYDHDNILDTPPFRVNDNRYTLEVFGGAAYQVRSVSFDFHYKYDQRTYEEYNVLHRARQQFTATTFIPFSSSMDFSMRYRFRRSQPQGQLGTIDYNQLRGHLRLPTLNTGLFDLNFRPYVMSDWNSGDFRKLDGLDGTGWSATGGIELTRPDGQWTTDVSVAYGDRKAQFFFFTHEYVETNVSIDGTMGSWARWIGMESASTTLELTYREAWYDGSMADDGSHRHDQRHGVSLSLSRPMSEYLDFVSTVEAENHESNWSVQDFFETRAMVGFRAEF